MSFVSSPPVAAATGTPADQVAHDAFFPGVTLAEMREGFRFFGQVSEERLRGALVGAMLSLSIELQAWQRAQLDAGVTSFAAAAELEAWPDRLPALYRRAIGAFAAAELAETHHDVAATGEGKGRAEERALSSDDYRRQATHAVRDILGATRTAVELI